MQNGNATSHILTTMAELEALYDEPPYGPAVVKEIDHINQTYRKLIEASPFFALATCGPDRLDCSPRGDPAGFVRVLDEKTVAVPDRRGNNRIDSLRNLIHDPRVALLFMIPGVNETLRIIGRARICAEPQLCASFTMQGKAPRAVLQALGPGDQGRPLEPADVGRDPRRNHRWQDGRPRARPQLP